MIKKIVLGVLLLSVISAGPAAAIYQARVSTRTH